MADTKYGHLIKPLKFETGGEGIFRQQTEMDGEFLGFDLNIRYGCYWAAGKMGKPPNGQKVCDYDQVMIWMGTDTYDMGYLGAETELLLGEQKERHMITTATAVAVPKEMPYFPATILRLEDRFIFMTISLSSKVEETDLPPNDQPVKPAEFMRATYAENVQNLAFTRNGPWHYGPQNADTHEGAITEIHGAGFDFHMSYESMNRAPYRFGPVPDKPHVHPYTEFLLFLGADTEDLSVLGAEAEIYMGKEMEKHVITTPTVAIQPKEQAHNPLIVLRQDRPWIFCVVRPWGHANAGPGPARRLD